MLGTRLGPYEILDKLDEGGMGEVYRATDANLGRQVAIKVLPASVAADADRLSRFDREARTLASLNHPNIAAVYGVERVDGSSALVMELVDGPTLADRIARGPIRVDEALGIARQIASALDAAHEQGIVHRDLKPANVKVRDDGMVKVLDFGLAKAMAVDAGSSAASLSPTMTSPAMTRVGVILGTAAYMSPEQARGRSVDRRADVWAFGVVLYEMVTGSRPFQGDDITETLASIVKDSPDLSGVPLRLRRLVAKCLEKDPRVRLRDIGDFELLVGEPDAGVATKPERRSRAAWMIGAAMSAAVVAGGAAWLARGMHAPPPARDVTLTIVSPDDMPLPAVGTLGSSPVLSPDGSSVLLATRQSLCVRRLDSLDLIRVPGSEDSNGDAFWSPDSKSVLYAVSGGWFRVRLPDGAREQVMEAPNGYGRSGTQSNGGELLVSIVGKLFWTRVAGGRAERVDVPGIAAGRVFYPQFLPDGRSFLFFLNPDDGSDGEVRLASFANGKVNDTVLLLKNETAARYTPAAGGRVLFVRDDRLFSQRLDLASRKLVGDTALVADHVASGPSRTAALADFSVSEDGVVAWRPGTAAREQVTAFDRHGGILGTSGPIMSIETIELSPDNRRFLVAGKRSWLFDVDQPGALPLQGAWRLWSPDGTRLIGLENGGIVERPLIGGGPHVLAPAAADDILQEVWPDGSRVLLRTGQNLIDEQRIDGPTAAGAPTPVLPLRVTGQSMSPDGRWLLYATDEGLFVQAYPGPGLRRQIVSGPLRFPKWRADGREIVFARRDAIYSIAVDLARSEPEFGAPQVLFSGVRFSAGATPRSHGLAISRDGSRIYVPQAVAQPAGNLVHVRTGALGPGA